MAWWLLRFAGPLKLTLTKNQNKIMIVKPSIQWLNTDSDPELVNDVSVIILGVGGNPAIYSKPSPDVPTLQTALTNFSTALAAVADGGPSATAKKNQTRLILIGLVRQLAAYVQTACGGNMTNLLLSGFPVQKSNRAPIGVLPAPSNPTLVLGSRTGDLDAGVNPVFGASIYNWKLTSSATAEAPRMAQSTASYFTFSDLTPGNTYSVTANCVGAAGPGDWSDKATQMAV
jgi:hypothetical protein